MEMSQLKTQIMTMFMMKSASAPAEKRSTTSELFGLVYTMMFMNLFELVFRYAPQFFDKVLKWADARWAWRSKKPDWLPLDNKTEKEKEVIHSVTLRRIFGDDEAKSDRTTNVFVEKVDAVLDYICGLDEAKHVRIDTRVSLNNTEEIALTPLLKARVNQTQSGGDDSASVVEIHIFSAVLKVSEIRKWIDEVHNNYMFEKNNKLGNKIYYFNEVPVEPLVRYEMGDGPAKKTYQWDSMPKMLTFTMNEFKTSKSFANVYGHHVDELKERLELFIKHPDWYMDRGIPHSLGIMLHGVPGAGKTSTIKAIAKDTNRHLFNLSLREHTTQRQLTNLFYNETVIIMNSEGVKQTLKIPLNRRVYVIEDIDCLTDVVLDRTREGAGTVPTIDKKGDAVTLSFLLNLLDGVLETPGRILIITSNYPEKLDRAFIRPGRIDVKIEFSNANREFIQDMLNRFYEKSFTLEDVPVELENTFTPAEIMESMCMHFKDPKKAIEHMVKKRERRLEHAKEMMEGTCLEDLGISHADEATAASSPAPASASATAPAPAPTLVVSDIEEPVVATEEKRSVGNEESVKNVDLKFDPNLTIDDALRMTESKSITVKNDLERILTKTSESRHDPRSIPWLPPIIHSTEKTLMQLSGHLPDDHGGDYMSAVFGDAEFLPGFAMPGDFGVRSTVDLNMMPAQSS